MAENVGAMKRLADVRLMWLLPLVGVSYILLGKASLGFATMPEGIAIAWFPNGLLLALFLVRPYKEWGWIALAVVPAEIIADVPTFTVLQALQFAGVNLLESSFSASLLRRFSTKHQSFNDTRSVVLFILLSLALMPSFSAIFGALIYHTQIETQTDFMAFWRIWFFGDSLGTLLLTPLIVSLAYLPLKGSFEKYFWLETFLSDALVLFLAFAIFSQPFNPSVLPATPMVFILLSLWIVYRQGLHLGMLLGFWIAMISVYFTVEHKGPFSVFDAVENTLYLQEFMAALLTAILFFGVLLRQINHNKEKLLDANEALKTLTEELEERVKHKTQALQDANVKLQELATKDALTGIYNRYYFQQALSDEIAKATRHQQALSIVLFDIDFFKKINDTYGHPAGDAVLVCIAQSVSKRLRQEDIFARIGGEEFIVVLPSTDEKNAYTLAHEIKDLIASLVVETPMHEIRCTVSLGVATLGGRINSFELLFAHADTKLYQAKAQGRNCVV